MKLEGFQHWITLAFLGVQEPSTYVHRSFQSKKKRNMNGMWIAVHMYH